MTKNGSKNWPRFWKYLLERIKETYISDPLNRNRIFFAFFRIFLSFSFFSISIRICVKKVKKIGKNGQKWQKMGHFWPIFRHSQKSLRIPYVWKSNIHKSLRIPHVWEIQLLGYQKIPLFFAFFSHFFALFYCKIIFLKNNLYGFPT